MTAHSEPALANQANPLPMRMRVPGFEAAVARAAVASRARAASAGNADVVQHPATCPATATGRNLVRTIAAMNRAQDEAMAARCAGDGPEEIAAKAREAIRSDRIYQLAGAITFDRATSLAGALHQVIVASSKASELIVCDLTPDQAEAVGKRLVRLLYSIRDALEAATGLDGEEMGGSYYMRADLNPFLALPEAEAGDVA